MGGSGALRRPLDLYLLAGFGPTHALLIADLQTSPASWLGRLFRPTTCHPRYFRPQAGMRPKAVIRRVFPLCRSRG